MTTLAENANRDIFVDPTTGNIALLSGIQQCAQSCKSTMETLIGECVLNLQYGQPYDAAAWTTYLPRALEVAARRALMAVLNVVSVVSYTVNQQGDELVWSATMATTFGQNVTVGGVIPNVQ